MTPRTVARLIALCAATAALTASRLPAQELPATESTLRAATHDALGDGRRAAEQRYVGGRLLVGGLAGVPLGFFGGAALFVGPLPPVVTGAALGGGVLLLARRPGDTTPPDSLAALAAREGPAYEQAWRAGYKDRLGARRRRAADVGGTVGAIIGAALVLTIFLDPNYT